MVFVFFFRQNYNYPSLLRLKRSILDQIILDFELKIPTFEWDKVLGSHKLGASFGIKFVNRLRALFRKKALNILNSDGNTSVYTEDENDIKQINPMHPRQKKKKKKKKNYRPPPTLNYFDW